MSKFIKKTSKNSHLPPAMDINRGKKSKAKNKRKPGGQPGHEGNTLRPVDNPDEIVELPVDRERLPPGKWKNNGYEKRQIFDMPSKKTISKTNNLSRLM